MSEAEDADCSEAYKNPSCPYVTQININTACMKQVDKALISLLGKDGTGLNDGVIHRMLLKLVIWKRKIRFLRVGWIWLNPSQFLSLLQL